MERLCQTCNVSIHDKPKRSLFCSLKCYHASMKGKVPNNIKQLIHAAALKKRGVGNRTLENANEWFWTKVTKFENGCWEWTGAKKTGGYGVLRWKNQSSYGAHRMSFWLTHGQEPKLFVLHSCDNPACVNPAHLRKGTHKENTQDAIERKRFASGEKAGAAKLTKKNIEHIRASSIQNIELAKMLNVSESTISKIKTGKLWRNV
jgi:hypothetical protein